MPTFDLIIRGGRVIDGTGAPARPADVAIAGGRIAAVDKLATSPAARVIDAAGLVVAPGFIDVHCHSDGWLLKTRNLVSKTAQGFTTEVLASDGISYAPVSPETAAHWLHYLRSLNGLEQRDYTGWESVADYLRLLDRATAQNTVFQAPYANIRTLAMGWRRGPPDDTELRRMRRLLVEALEQGARAVSTGLDYISQCFATSDELVEVCSAGAPYDALYVTHIRYKRGLLPALREAVDVARRSGLRLHVSHLKATSAEELEQLLEFMDRVACRQVDFSFDVYPYLPGSTMLNFLLPYEVWEDGPLAAAAKLSNHGLRRRFAEQLTDYALPLDRIRVAWARSGVYADEQGQSLAELVRRRGKPVADVLCDLLLDANLAVLCVFDSGDDRLVEPMLRHERFMLGSDGIFFPGGLVHPRQYGSAPRLIGPLVRDRRLFTLEDAVRKMTAWPAERFSLPGRGLIAPGAAADLVVFDPATVCDTATFERPTEAPAGVVHVLVNGVDVISAGRPVVQFDGPAPGRALVERR